MTKFIAVIATLVTTSALAKTLSDADTRRSGAHPAHRSLPDWLRWRRRQVRGLAIAQSDDPTRNATTANRKTSPKYTPIAVWKMFEEMELLFERRNALLELRWRCTAAGAGQTPAA
ncbi:hypothetical protein [Bradyrhizobium sp. 139]|uniref:hypothetical protein n=1 Tax=Bradyrhizobium sp. 139 TaxID=2782616 RepID=UPI001FFAE824|nr:hypothetical protein [Bradyrhizobium sp. 139]